MTRRTLLVAGVALALVAGGAWWFARAPRGGAPILLITIDTLRADAISALGGAAPTPNLDRLAAEGALFGQAQTAVPLTGPSHATILSGRFPYRHGIRDNGQSLAPDQPGLPAWLHAAGYRTGGFVSGFPLHRQFGFDHGFDHYDDAFAGAEGNPFALRERRAEDTVQAAQRWIETNDASPWFAWVHLFDPHTPYTAPEAFRQDGPFGGYYAEIAYTDHWIGELVASVRKRHPDAIVVVTSDHGEGLGDHGEYDHGLMLYQSTLRVPLIVSAPGRLPPQRADVPVRTADIAPTLLDLAGAPPQPNLDGVDLAPDLRRGAAPSPPPAYSESYFAAVTYGWAPLKAMREGVTKRIEGARAETFDLAADPHEDKPLADAARGARLESLLATVPEPPPPAAGDAPSAAAVARLRSLGYLGAGAPVTAARWRNDVDPRDRLAEHADVLRAQEALDQRRWADAESRLRAILETSPDNRVAWLRLGTLKVAQRVYDDGIAALRRAVEVDPENPEARYQLGDALLRARRYAEAADVWSDVVARQPKRAAAWSNLGSALLLSGRQDAAIGAYEEAVAVAPDAANLRENLARALLRAGRPKDAIAALEAQARIDPQRFALGALLALHLAEAGKLPEAEGWIARATAAQEAYPEAHLALAIRLAKSDGPRAAEHLRAALAAQPALRASVEADAELAALLAQP